MPDHFAGIVAGEALHEGCMLRLISHIKPGVTEVMLHPGTENDTLQKACRWQHDFEAELRAVTSPQVLEKLRERGVEPVNFSSLTKGNQR